MISCFPSPLERGPAQGKNPKTGEPETREPKEDGPLSAFIFKTIADPFAGKLNLFRVYSGSINADSAVYNSKKEVKERIAPDFLIGREEAETRRLCKRGRYCCCGQVKGDHHRGHVFVTRRSPSFSKRRNFLFR